MFVDERFQPSDGVRPQREDSREELRAAPTAESGPPAQPEDTPMAPLPHDELSDPAPLYDDEDMLSQLLGDPAPLSAGSASSSDQKELRVPRIPPEIPKQKVPPNEGLTSHWKRTKVTGKGLEMLESIAYLFDDDPDRPGFLQVRLMAPKARKKPARKPPKKKDGDKNLSYNHCSPDI